MLAPAHAGEGPPDPVLVLVLAAVLPPAPPSPVDVEVEPPPEPLPVVLPQPASIEAKEIAINEQRALRMIGENTPDPRKSGANLGHFDPA
jgi:hypothetical protein